MIGICLAASIASGWRNMTSTSKSCPAFFAPASHRSQNGSVQFVTTPILILSDFLLHAGTHASTAARATTTDTRSIQHTVSPAFERGPGNS